ncbi:MAG: 2-furoyl-CoA dehydrogenase binding subunit [Methylobacteriaceae bacterium]|nr:2-furoyl-CoA dehydrogenase binding subunit [Methylobacteriaceae bacterium]
MPLGVSVCTRVRVAQHATLVVVCGMKAAPFEYIRPRTLAEACSLLAENEDALPIAGGQTLVPLLAMRLARPMLLVDILRLPELSGITRANGFVVVGATTRQAEAEKSALIAADVPLLAKALPWVGHQPTRNRGTVGGSVANADPAAEIPLVAVTLGAEIVVQSQAGATAIPASEFFLGAMATALEPGSCVKELRIPVWSRGRIGAGFHEISARKSDFAYASAAAQIALDEDGKCIDVALGLGGLGDRPVRVALAGLIGKRPADANLADIVQDAVREVAANFDLRSDIHASANYRRRLAVALAQRAMRDAVHEASQAPGTGA